MADFFVRMGAPEWQWIWSALQTVTLVSGFYFVIRQIRLAQIQNSITHLNYLRDLWISRPILRARSCFHNEPVTVNGEMRPFEDAMCSFFNDIGIAIRTGQLDKLQVARHFGYFIEGYWLLMADQIKCCRDSFEDQTIYSSFEHLYDVVLAENKRLALGRFPASRLKVFAKEEAALADFYRDA